MFCGKRADATPVNEIGNDPHTMESKWTLAPSDEEEDSTDVNLFVGSITREEEQQPGLWFKDIVIQGQTVHFKLDTGSEVNLMPKHIFDKLTRTELKPTKCNLITYTGQWITPI